MLDWVVLVPIDGVHEKEKTTSCSCPFSCFGYRCTTRSLQGIRTAASRSGPKSTSEASRYYSLQASCSSLLRFFRDFLVRWSFLRICGMMVTGLCIRDRVTRCPFYNRAGFNLVVKHAVLNTVRVYSSSSSMIVHSSRIEPKSRYLCTIPFFSDTSIQYRPTGLPGIFFI